MRRFYPKIREYHGFSRTKVYKVWLAMKNRCNNPRSVDYHNYGGRGITVCEEWNRSFAQFFVDMGNRPSDNYSIERVDNNKGYSKYNCIWILRSKQNKNKRNLIMFLGENASEATRRLHLSEDTIRLRLKRGWSKKMAFTTPRLPHGKFIDRYEGR